MTQFKSHLWITVAVLLLAFTVWIGNEASRALPVSVPVITERDSVIRNLLLWQDTNHNGISEASEVRTLNQLGLTAIECDYKESKHKDQFGNQFRYRAKVRDQRDTRVNRWAWDVFLVRDTTNPVVANVLDLVNPREENISNWLRN